MKWGIFTAMWLVVMLPGLSASQEARFTVNGDGTVTDNVTGLEWQRCSAGLSGSECSVGSAANQTWESALACCEDLVLPPGGHSDWRLPDVKELRSIVDNTRYNPAIDPAAFPGTVSSAYWSSSTGASAAGTSSAWGVGFHDGLVYGDNKSVTRYVRCVR